MTRLHRLTRILAAVFVALTVIAPALLIAPPASAQTDVETFPIPIPHETRHGEPGTEHVVYKGPSPAPGRTCDASFTANNNTSVHSTNLILDPGGLILQDVERAPGAVTVGAGKIELEDAIRVTLVIGVDGKDDISSLGGMIVLTCEAPPPPPTTEAPVIDLDVDFDGSCSDNFTATVINNGNVDVTVLDSQFIRPYDGPLPTNWTVLEAGKTYTTTWYGTQFRPDGPVLWFEGEYRFVLDTDVAGFFARDVTVSHADDPNCKLPPVPEPPPVETTTTSGPPPTTEPTVTVPPTTDPPPVTAPPGECVEDDTSSTGWRWSSGDEAECLPFTGPEEGDPPNVLRSDVSMGVWGTLGANYTSELRQMTLWGLGWLGLGGLMLAVVRRRGRLAR